MRSIVLTILLMMLIHTTSSAETTNNLVSQDFTTGWTNTGNSTHGSTTIAGIHGGTVESDSVSLNAEGINKESLNNGFSITGSASVWFWNNETQSVTQTIKTVDDNGQTITQNRTLSGTCATWNGCSYGSMTDTLIIGSNSQQDYDVNLKYSFSVPNQTSGHYGADLKDPSLTVSYTYVPPLDSATQTALFDMNETLTEDLKFDDFKFEDEVKMEEPVMVAMKEEEKFEEEPIMEEIEEFNEEEKEEKPIEMLEESFTEEQKEESNNKTTETSNTENESEDEAEQKDVKQEETKTAKLEGILNKIDEEVKQIDKNLVLKNLVKLKVMSSGNLLDAYNIPFYEPKIIYEDQVQIQDNRVIYTKDLIQYKQNDPIAIKNQKLYNINQERQRIINEIRVLQNEL